VYLAPISQKCEFPASPLQIANWYADKRAKAYRIQESEAERYSSKRPKAVEEKCKWRLYHKRIKETVQQHHLQMYFKKKTHATSTCRLGESNKEEHWGEMIDAKTRETAVEAWTNKHGNKTVPWKIITQWYPLEQLHENRGRRFENKRRNVGVEVGKCACGATATLQRIASVTDCRRQDKQEITEDARKESEKHIAQSHMPKTVKEVMSHMNKYTWNSMEAEKKGLKLGEQQWDETQRQIAQAMQARWTGAVNKGRNNKRLREVIITTGTGNEHTPNTIDLLVSDTNNDKMETRERKN
jgi:hypothetical protein